MNKVKWKKNDSGENTVMVFEDFKWKHYTSSKMHVPDKNGFSKGYLTFLNCIKNNYEITRD
jgi:hypothetical protein